MAIPGYGHPTYSHNGSSGTGAGLTIDISMSPISGFPPVLIISLSSTGSVRVEASHNAVNWVTMGTVTSSDALDLIPGIQFWRTYIDSNAGVVTSAVGPVPMQGGGSFAPGHYMVENNATEGM